MTPKENAETNNDQNEDNGARRRNQWNSWNAGNGRPTITIEELARIAASRQGPGLPPRPFSRERLEEAVLAAIQIAKEAEEDLFEAMQPSNQAIAPQWKPASKKPEKFVTEDEQSSTKDC